MASEQSGVTPSVAPEVLGESMRLLQTYIRSLKKVAVAFSGGVDSTFLLRVCVDTLGADSVIAVTAASASFPLRERQEAIDFAKSLGVRHFVVESEELDIPGFRDNPTNRCYLCKKELFTKIQDLAEEEGADYVLEGSNMDDNGDYRPGLTAISELGVCSPLRYAGLYKVQIRALSQQLGLPTWKKPSFACLASRFVYGEKITVDKLDKIDRLEQYLIENGFEQVRVRVHGDAARIEVAPNEISRFLEESFRTRTALFAKAVGFPYVSLDLMGYRTGSMNETLPKEVLEQGLH